MNREQQKLTTAHMFIAQLLEENAALRSERAMAESLRSSNVEGVGSRVGSVSVSGARMSKSLRSMMYAAETFDRDMSRLRMDLINLVKAEAAE